MRPTFGAYGRGQGRVGVRRYTSLPGIGISKDREDSRPRAQCNAPVRLGVMKLVQVRKTAHLSTSIMPKSAVAKWKGSNPCGTAACWLRSRAVPNHRTYPTHLGGCPSSSDFDVPPGG